MSSESFSTDGTGVPSTASEIHLQEKLVNDLETLYEDQSTFDLDFLVGVKPERVRAHKLIVLCRCEKYRSKKQQWFAPVTGYRAAATVRLEKYDPKAVKSVVKYLYCGKIDLSREDVFQILSLCTEFGLPVLKTYCIEHLGGTLTVDGVCDTLVGAHTLLETNQGDGTLKEIVQKCLKFVEGNTRAVFQSKGFLHLSKEMVIVLVSSNELSLPEEDVWRAVLRWGKHHSDVQQTMLLWTEADRMRMKESLQGVLECVRVMEINSEVFAKEVEPTGLLPMEMTLARYRHAAVHGKGGNNSTDSTRPRSGTQEAFVGTEILEGRADFQLLINEWCESPSQEWVLLYRGSRDGFHARNFHSCCDDKGATVVITKTPSGCIFGGYTDIAWSSRFKRGKYTSSSQSFLFTLVNPTNTPPTKFLVQHHAYAINNHPGNGPIFGSGADLYISSECNRNKDSYSKLHYAYGDSSTAQHLLTGEQYFSVEDYEVFGVAR